MKIEPTQSGNSKYHDGSPTTVSWNRFDLLIEDSIYYRYASRAKEVTNAAQRHADSREIARLKSVEEAFYFL